MSDGITEDDFEKAFFADDVNYKRKDGDTNKQIITNPNGGVTIHKTVDLDPYLKQAQLDRERFATTNNTQDHVRKIASIPKAVYYAIMDRCDMLGIKTQKERNAFLIQQLQKPEFEALLSLPKGQIRKSR